MATPVRKTSLEELLVKRDLISREELDEHLHQAAVENQPLRLFLIEHNVISEQAMGETLAEQYGLTFDPLTDFRVDPDFFTTIPVEWMHRHPFAPVSDQDGILTIAIADPQDLRAIDELELLLGREVRLVISTRSSIMEGLAASEGNKQVLTRIQAELHPVLVKEDEKGEEILSVERITKDQSPVVKLVDTIILSALQKQVSDIHIEATDRALEVKFRIDGVLYPRNGTVGSFDSCPPHFTTQGDV